MNKYEIKYLLESMTSAVDRLTDTVGKQSTHIGELWDEIGRKASKINEIEIKNRRLMDLVDRYRRKYYAEKVDQAKAEKSLAEYMGDSVDN